MTTPPNVGKTTRRGSALCVGAQRGGGVGLRRPAHSRVALRTLRSARRRATDDDGVGVSIDTDDAAPRSEASVDDASSGDAGTSGPSRRAILRAASLSVAAASLYVGVFRTKAFKYLSVSGVWSTLFPPKQVGMDRIERYIQDFENANRGTPIPDFDKGLTWFNSAPLSVSKELRGKVVILDFWTYCCINCMHVLPDLRRLEEDFADSPFAVVGVHSAKFDNERDDDAIRNAIVRYGVVHPAVNDKDMSLWRALGISSWPSLLVLTPSGKVLARFAGEGHYDDLKAVVSAALRVYGERGELVEAPIPQALERDKASEVLNSNLKYPGKLAVDAVNGRLFISDSGNHRCVQLKWRRGKPPYPPHPFARVSYILTTRSPSPTHAIDPMRTRVTCRIVVCKTDGTFLFEIGAGGGTPGFSDGALDACAFASPQGVAYDAASDALFVADTENHAVRLVDLRRRTVRTILGDGTKGFDLEAGKAGASQRLNSPWDVCLSKDGSQVFIAMAGQHQIWAFDRKAGTARIVSGNGYERNQNAPTGQASSWAQPSGLALSALGDRLFVADSESSSIRSLAVDGGASRPEAGGDPSFADNLFAFGDKDGRGAAARLQHPLGVCMVGGAGGEGGDGVVYVADSYNHRIKALDVGTKTVRTVAGTGRAGFKDGPSSQAQLSEPAGLVRLDDATLLVADTNNGVIRRLDLADGTITALDTSSVPRPAAPTNIANPSSDTSGKAAPLKAPIGATVVDLGMRPLTAEGGELTLDISLPVGYHYTKGVRSGFNARTGGGRVAFAPSYGDLSRAPVEAVRLAYAPAKAGGNVGPSDISGDEEAMVDLKVYYCKEESACAIHQVTFKVRFSREAGAGFSREAVAYDVPAPAPDANLWNFQ